MHMGETTNSKGARRRTEILKVARASLIDGGYGKFSMREIAARLDTKLGHLQYYFPSKNDLLEALVRAEFKTNLATVKSIAEKALEENDAIKRAIKALLQQWMSEGAKIYAVTTFLGLHDERFHDVHQELNESFYDVLDGLLSSTGTGVSGSNMPRQKLRLITALIDGALLHTTGDIQVDDQFFEATAEPVKTIAQS